MKKKLLIFLAVFMLIFVVYSGFITYKLKQYSSMVPPKNVDYLIILGAKVNGTEPSWTLYYRIEAAADYLKENPKTIAILSGGQGSDEGISEAEAMHRQLIEDGISEERLIVEDKSTSTEENIGFSKKLMNDDMKTGIIVTNDFHVYRAVKIAEKQGLDVTGLAAKTPPSIKIQSTLREYIAIPLQFFAGEI